MKEPMSTVYVFAGGSERRPLEILPEGDYGFTISDFDPPYQKSDGKWVLKVRLEILGQTIFDAVWSGETSTGEQRDQIGELLLCVNRAPALGEEPDWRRIAGAKGKCHLKVEIAQQGALAGKQRNVVSFYYRPKEIGPTTEIKQDFNPEELTKQKAQSAKAAGKPDDIGPDDIPF
jgi:hypothetical protein